MNISLLYQLRRPRSNNTLVATKISGTQILVSKTILQQKDREILETMTDPWTRLRDHDTRGSESPALMDCT